ncbi:flagellar assembly lytic transglycosylase [Spirochaeta cellobiosiphila]|uniref:flagellar assembly lytic transglycosylase n=1 Tax=Spirochaeta cellobiosiphila TaxID=504483 RepID=UPI00048B2740|nr:lytic transglycosylase domain-containing protein [Spirochaeta cellobiosiphila]
MSCHTDESLTLYQASQKKAPLHRSTYPHGYWFFTSLDENLSPQERLEYLKKEGTDRESPWREEAIERVIQLYNQNSEWANLKNYLEPLVKEDKPRNIWLYNYGLSMYWQDQRVESLDVWEKVDLTQLSSTLQEEYYLILSVSLWEKGIRVIPPEMISLLTKTSPSSLDLRLASYVEIHPEFDELFDEDLLAIKDLRLALARNSYNQIYDLLDQKINIPSSLYYSIYRYFLNQNQYTKGSQWFGQKSDTDSSFYKGLLDRQYGYYDRAYTSFSEIEDQSSSIPMRRVLWYQLDSAFRTDFDKGIELLSNNSSVWQWDEYFEDLFENIRLKQISKRQGNGLVKLWPLLSQYGTAEIKSSYAYTIARMSQIGWINKDEEYYFNQAYQAYPWGFYAIMSRYKTHQEYGLPNGLRKTSGPKSVVYEDALWEPYLWFGVVQEGAEKINLLKPNLSASLLLRYADELIKEDLPLLSIRIMNLYWDSGYEINNEELLRFYPQAYKKMMDQVIQKEKLYSPIFWGLVREESHFQADIGSHAGAIGLSQLMPSTAAEEAKRIKLKDFDLKNPNDNLTLGSHYLRRLRDRTDSYSDALMAYNAGLTRLRRWKNQYSRWPSDLFIDVIPFEETRNYNKKVLVSSVFYGMLYDQRTAEEVLDKFF